MCLCPAIPIATLGTPRMCEHCPLLRTARNQTPSTPMSLRRCHACVLPMDATPPHTVCPGCIVYALFHQNTFLQRWHEIQGTIKPTPPLQHHRSIHRPAPVLGPGILCHLGGAPTPPKSFPTTPPRHVIDLTLHPYA